MSTDIDTKSDLKKSRKFPAHSLQPTLEFLTTLDSNLGRGPFARSAMSEALGHASESGPFSRKAGALVHYGLLDREGTTYKISKIGESILRPTSESERSAALVTAALEPAINREIVERFRNQALPGLLHNILIRDFGVHASSGEDVASIFRETMTFVHLLRNGILHDAPAAVSPAAEIKNNIEPGQSSSEERSSRSRIRIGDFVQWSPGGQQQFVDPRKVRQISASGDYAFVEGSDTGLPIVELTVEQPPVAPSERETGVATSLREEQRQTQPPLDGVKSAVFPTEKGQVTLQYPADLTTNDVQDLEDWLAIVLRKMKRSLQ